MQPYENVSTGYAVEEYLIALIMMFPIKTRRAPEQAHNILSDTSQKLYIPSWSFTSLLSLRYSIHGDTNTISLSSNCQQISKRLSSALINAPKLIILIYIFGVFVYRQF